MKILNRKHPPARRALPQKAVPLSAQMDLHALDAGMPGITPAFGQYLRQAATVCLEERSHQPGVEMPVEGAYVQRYIVSWSGATMQERRCLGDPEVATEHGAYGIAALLAVSLTGMTVIERSRKGTGFDFWLGPKKARGGLFQKRTRLEISGVRDGDNGEIKSRVRLKLDQTKQSDHLRLPAYVVVVEFSRPISHVAKR